MLMNKIDYAKMGENYMPDHGGIEDAITKTQATIYVVYRHGVHKRYLSRSAAINCLARVTATQVYNRQQLRIRESSIYNAESDSWSLGELTDGYIRCRQRAKRRILRLLAKQRNKEKWQREYDEWASKHDDLMKRRPY
ncbi:hypothetical protein [Serratia marcescens]|uniref:hypothetical protein n=2 Tax=Serratia TaxID=613 RepID=UPI000931207C|nr:hypothetical protein [Serratia marcescens]